MAAPSGFVNLMPEPVRAVLVTSELEPSRLWPREEAAVADATMGRQAEYRTTRECARVALQDLGLPPVEIPTGEHREPIWPDGVVGSLTHCADLRAAAVARESDFRALGIDVEPARALPPGVLDVIATDDDRTMVRELSDMDPTVPWGRVLFCAKEAIFKAWFPLTRVWIGYTSCSVRIHPETGTFTARFDSSPPAAGNLVSGQDLVGKWREGGGFVFTAVHVPWR
ncbi:4'-phosphopantetheinyl transferase family protein [Brevibacterium ammoniilyticum]